LSQHREKSSLYFGQPTVFFLYSSPPVMRRPLLRCAALLVCLAFLLPLAAAADSCAECIESGTAPVSCTLPSCCSACAHKASLLTATAWEALSPTPTVIEVRFQTDRILSSPPRDIFHVPKSSLL
jgi:hypothetical protein